jgi:hypothetical protein
MAGIYGGYLGNEGGMANATLGPIAGNPFGSQFVIPQRGIRGMTPAQVEELKQWDPQSAPAINDIYRGVKPGGAQLPLVQSAPGTMPMGNAGFFMGSQYAQMPAGFTNRTVS